jgi:hypothetical protein
MIAAWGSSLWSDCAAASKGGCCSQPSVDAMPQTDAHFQAIIPCLCPPMAMHMHTGYTQPSASVPKDKSLVLPAHCPPAFQTPLFLPRLCWKPTFPLIILRHRSM